jgi:hypothetical protein
MLKARNIRIDVSVLCAELRGYTSLLRTLPPDNCSSVLDRRATRQPPLSGSTKGCFLRIDQAAPCPRLLPATANARVGGRS